MAHLKISPDFFKTEVREDFPVGELMKRNWAAQLQVLEDVREMCAKHDIKWFAYAGTALGAVRHKGFIPWDDDIDICMTGDNFIKFLYYATDDLKDKYRQVSAYSDKTWDIRDITRISNDNKMNFGEDHLDKWFNCPFAIGTDIFPLYYIPRDKEKEEFVTDLLLKVESLFEINDYYIDLLKAGRNEEAKGLEELISASIIGLQEDTGFEFNAERTLANQLCQLFDQICRFTTEDEADYVTRMHPYLTSRGYKFRKEMFYESCNLPFEMIEVPVPKDYVGYCSMIYGPNYMTPIRGEASHDYPYFGKQLRVVQSKIELRDWQRKLHADDTLTFSFPGRQELSESKNEKCVVLYYTSVREMLIYDEYVIDKIRDMLKYFEQHKDTMTLYWCPGGFIEPSDTDPDFKRLVPDLIEQYESLIEEYKASGLGICDESGEIKKACEKCDMYYGDEGFISEMFGKTGKPVYIQDYHTRLMGDTVGSVPIKSSAIFEGKIKPKFDDAVYLEDGKGYAFAKNMNGLFKVDREKKTCEFFKFFPHEKPNGQYLYTSIKKLGDKLMFIPGSANNAMLFDPSNNTFKEYNVYTDTLNNWFDFLKFADVVENEGKWYFIGERYSHILKVDPETGEKTMIDTGHESTVWMRHGAIQEGGLVKIISSNTTEMLTFNLRTEKLFVKKEYNYKEMYPKLQALAEKACTLKDEEYTLIGDLDEYIDEAFKSYDDGTKGMVIVENEDWISFEETVKYVNWKKTGKK